MISINLLPAEYRIVEKKQTDLPIKKLLIGGGVLFVAISLILYVDFLIVSMKLKGLEKEWVEKQPAFQQLSLLRNDVDGALKHEKEFMERFVTTRRPLTTIMMWISEYLPDAAWITDVNLEQKEDKAKFRVKGLALPSREKSSIEQIEEYLQKLKEQMPDAALSLTTTRQMYEGVALTEFIARFSWEVGEKV